MSKPKRKRGGPPDRGLNLGLFVRIDAALRRDLERERKRQSAAEGRDVPLAEVVRDALIAWVRPW